MRLREEAPAPAAFEWRLRFPSQATHRPPCSSPCHHRTLLLLPLFSANRKACWGIRVRQAQPFRPPGRVGCVDVNSGRPPLEATPSPLTTLQLRSTTHLSLRSRSSAGPAGATASSLHFFSFAALVMIVAFVSGRTLLLSSGSLVRLTAVAGRLCRRYHAANARLSMLQAALLGQAAANASAPAVLPPSAGSVADALARLAASGVAVRGETDAVVAGNGTMVSCT